MRKVFLLFILCVFSFPFLLLGKEGDTVTKNTILKTVAIKNTKYFCLHMPTGTQIATKRANGTYKNAKLQNVISKLLQNRETNKKKYQAAKNATKKRKYKQLYNKFKKAYSQAVTCKNFKTAKYACDSFKLEQNNENAKKAYFKIIKGEPCDEVESVVAKLHLHYKNGEASLCTGTLIKSDVILTAAHCLESTEDMQLAYVLVTIGGRTYDVKSFFYNPLYSQYSYEETDTGIVILSEKLPYKPMPLVKKGTSAKKGDIGAIIGYGVTKFNMGKEKTSLYVTGFRAGYALIQQVTPSGILSNFKNTDGTANTCNGDSGGPLAIYEDGEWRLFGITSWGDDQYCGYLSGHEHSWWSRINSKENIEFLTTYLGDIYSK